MPASSHHIKLVPALMSGSILIVGSSGALVAADRAADSLAVAGMTAGVVGAALITLTLVAWRWGARDAAYSATAARDIDARFEPTAEVFDAPDTAHGAGEAAAS